MLRKCFLAFAFVGLTLPSAFAQGLVNDTTANVSIERDQTIVIYKLFSLGIENSVTQAGASSTIVHEITGEASIALSRCMRGGCVGMPKKGPAAFIFKSSVTDQNPSNELLFFSCRRAIETSKAGDTIILTGDIKARPEGDFQRIAGARVFEFIKLTDCEVQKDGPFFVIN